MPQLQRTDRQRSLKTSLLHERKDRNVQKSVKSCLRDVVKRVEALQREEQARQLRDPPPFVATSPSL